MKIRKHVGSLSESMETIQEIEPTLNAVKEWVKSTFNHQLIDLDDLTVEKYGPGIDTRIGWNTYIVHSKPNGVLGFTDGPVT